MKQLVSLLFILIAFSCSEKKISEPVIDIVSNIVMMGEAIQHQKVVKISEIVDSISFIPLETKPECFLRSTYWVIHTPPYLWFPGGLFDYEGNFFMHMVKEGQGPCEDIYSSVAKVSYNQKKDIFLSKSSKLILYDKDGNCTGKERRLYTGGVEGKVASGIQLLDLATAQENFILNDGYDTLLWLDSNLEFIKKQPFPIPGNISKLGNKNIKTMRLFTSHRDSTLLYNYWNDTIYRIKSVQIEQRWIIDLGEEKISNDVRLRYKELSEEMSKFTWAFTRQGKIRNPEECDLIRLTKDKKGIWSVFETSSYLFLFWSEIVPGVEFFELFDFKRPYQLQIAYYDKLTGETIAVKGAGFEDDIMGTGHFFPALGTFEDKLVKMVWPYELNELLDLKREKGETIHPRLSALEQQVDIEDNPILIVAHLKK